MKGKKKKHKKMFSGDQKFIESERDNHNKMQQKLLDTSTPDIGINIDEFGTPAPQPKQAKVPSKTPVAQRGEISTI